MAWMLYPQLFEPVFTPPLLADRWHQPASLPTQRRPPRPAMLPALAWSGFTPSSVVETVTIDKWFQPASQPTAAKRGLTRAIDASDGAAAPAGPPAAAETVTIDKWQQPVSQPTYRRGPPAAVVASAGRSASPAPVVVSAPKVANVHYNLTAWTGSTAYAVGARVSSGGQAWQVIKSVGGGTSGVGPAPNGVGGPFPDGLLIWAWLSTIDYTSLDDWNADTTNYPLAMVQPYVVQLWNNTSIPAGTTPTISVSGAFSLSAFITSTTNTITIKAAPGESFRDTLANQHVPLAFNPANGVSFSMPATGTLSDNWFNFTSDNVIIDGLQFRNPNAADISTVINFGGNASRLQNCIVDGYGQASGAWLVGGSSVTGGLTIDNCLIVDRETNNLGGTLAVGYASLTVVNCTIVAVAATTGVSAVFNTSAGSTTTAKNCIIVNYDAASSVNTAGTANVDHSLFSTTSLTTSGVTTGSGCVFSQSAAATFTAPYTDFRLLTGSAAINAGATDTTDIPTSDDIARTIRPVGAAWDIGAWENFPTPTPPAYTPAPSQPTYRTGLSAAVRAATGPIPSPFPLGIVLETVTIDKWFQPASQPTAARRGLTRAIDASDGAAAPAAPVALTTWDPAFKAATLTLSNGNLTVTASAGSAFQLVRSTTTQSAGKVYWEVTVGTITPDLAFGFGNASVTTSSILGQDVNSVAFVPGASGPQQTQLNGVNLNTGSTASTSGEVVSIALNITNKLVWISDSVMRAAGNPWNNSPTANPSTNTGGQALTVLAAGPYYAMFMAFQLNSAVTANFGSAAFSQPVPVGFAAWDSPAQAETVTVDKWHQPASQPTPRLPNRAAMLPALAWSGFTPPFVPETITADKWQQPASQPTYRRGQLAALQATLGASPILVPPAETITADKWQQPASQPVPRRRLPAAVTAAAGPTFAPAALPNSLTTWNPAFKAATLSLSNGNLTVTASAGSAFQLVRSTTTQSAGKVYWEVTVGTITPDLAFGFGNASVTTSSILGQDVNSVAFVPGASGPQQTQLNGVNLNTGSTASTSGEVVSIALNITNKLVWISDSVMRAAGNPWNNSPTANPSTNTGGQALTVLAAGPYYAMFMAFQLNGAVTANFGSAAFSQPVPVGFAAWDSPAQPETVTIDKWHQPNSQPTRRRPGYAAALPAMAWAGFTPRPLRPRGAIVNWMD